MSRRKMFLAFCSVALSFGAVAAQAQWVMVARAVSGRIQQMSNKAPDGTGYDVGTVVLMANADKVYQTALTSLKTNHPDVTITSSDAKKHEIKFSKGAQVASMQATPLSEKITQLVVASNIVPGQPDATPVVVQGILKVCEQMNVVCTQSGD